MKKRGALPAPPHLGGIAVSRNLRRLIIAGHVDYLQAQPILPTRNLSRREHGDAVWELAPPLSAERDRQRPGGYSYSTHGFQS